MTINNETAFACRTAAPGAPVVKLGHGSGGKLTEDLISTSFLSRLGTVFGGQLQDAAVQQLESARIAVTTDAYVVSPYRFPGGDIGSLAVFGSVNDLAVRGARAKFLSAAFILEEGLPIDELESIVDSFKRACEISGVTLIAADTKVVNKGACDKIFITTTAIGELTCANPPAAESARPGDIVLVSGHLGMHGMAVMCAREELELTHDLLSDSAPLTELCATMLSASTEIHCMRDITRGGLATVLCELAEASGVGIEINETALPIHAQVGAACELLGLDPLYVACEGQLVAIVASSEAEEVLYTMRHRPEGVNAAIIGTVVTEHPKHLVLKSSIGGARFVGKLSGDQLPRIC